MTRIVLARTTLVVGLSLAQYSPRAVAVEDASASARFMGLLAVFSAATTSGLAGVYFELLLKSPGSIWVRNAQLALTSLPFAIFFVLYGNGGVMPDFSIFLREPLVLAVLLNQACGGLLIGLVVRATSQLAKSLAAGVAIITSSVASAIFFEFEITTFFVTGSAITLFSVWMYASPKSIAPFCPKFLQEPEEKPLL